MRPQRLIAMCAATVMAIPMTMTVTGAQAAPEDYDWLGSPAGTLTVANPSSSIQVSLLADGTRSVMAYRMANQLVLAAGTDQPGSAFTEFATIDLTGQIIQGTPRLDAGANNSTVVSYLVRIDERLAELVVRVFDTQGLETDTLILNNVVSAQGYDLGIDGEGAITVAFADDFEGQNRIGTYRISDNPGLQYLSVSARNGRPRIVVDENGDALAMWENVTQADPDRGVISASQRRGAAGRFALPTRPFNETQVQEWTVDGDGRGYVSVFFQDAATTSLMAMNNPALGDGGWESDLIDGFTSNLRWLSVDVTNAVEKTYFWSKDYASGSQGVLARARSVRNPESGIGLTLGRGLAQPPVASHMVGVDSEGLPWLVWSSSSVAGRSPQLRGTTYSLDSADPTNTNPRSSLVGEATFGILRADAVAFDNGTMLAAWIAIVDNRNALMTRWMGSSPPPAAPTDVRAEILQDESVRVTWSNTPQPPGATVVSNAAQAQQVGGALLDPICTAAAEAVSCVIPAGTLTQGETYVFRVAAVDGDERSSLSAASPPLTIPVDPGPDPDPGPGPGPGPDPDPDPVVGTIVITGSRGEVRGKKGVIVQGVTTGLVGETVMPRYRFPGQVEYSDGVARRTVPADGLFTWARKTGKRLYVKFQTVDGQVQSERIIIRT